MFNAQVQSKMTNANKMPIGSVAVSSMIKSIGQVDESLTDHYVQSNPMMMNKRKERDDVNASYFLFSSSSECQRNYFLIDGQQHVHSEQHRTHISR